MPVDEALRTGSALRRATSGLALAVAFLTILPVRVGANAAAGGLGSAAGWFPLVGAAIGALAGGVRAGTEPLLGSAAATVLAMAALVIVTGALHQDGLADTADGLGVRGDRGRRLAAMRDSSTGVFGALALIGWALLLFTALEPLSTREGLAALIAAGALSRWAALVHTAAAPAARADGLGAGFAVGRTALLSASAIALLATGLVAGLVPGLAATGAAVAIALLSALAARRAVGGRTGDTIGATVAVAELAVCTTLLGFWR